MLLWRVVMCSVRFIGETDVVDEGGVTRELFNLGALMTQPFIIINTQLH